jgi:voltage-gated potassium channel
VVLVSLICLNVVCIVLESVGTIRVAYGALFRTVEMISVAVFSFEYLARIWSSPDIADRNYADSILGRCRYALTPAAIVDLLAIAPFYLSVFVGVDLRFLRVIQLLRVLKLTSYSATMQSILQVFRDESNAFVATFCLLLVILVLASSGIYVFEHEAEPDKFSSIPAAMWWAMATLTTVGYGDVTPITPMAQLFGGGITLVSIGVVALPAGILASGFTKLMQKNRTTYEDKLADALADGIVTAGEHDELEHLRQRLDISLQDAEVVYRAFLRNHATTTLTCPHCQAPLTDLDSTDHHPPH